MTPGALRSSDGAAAVDRLAEDVDHTAEQAFAHGNRSDLARALDAHPFGHLVDIVQQNDADIAFLEVKGHALYAVFKLYELVGAHVVESIHMGHTVAYLEHLADFLEVDRRVDALELLF